MESRMRRDERYRVQTRGSGERGWRTYAVIADLDAALREAQRAADQLGRGGMSLWRTYAYVRVMQGEDIIAAWLHGHPVGASKALEMGGGA